MNNEVLIVDIVGQPIYKGDLVALRVTKTRSNTEMMVGRAVTQSVAVIYIDKYNSGEFVIERKTNWGDWVKVDPESLKVHKPNIYERLYSDEALELINK